MSCSTSCERTFVSPTYSPPVELRREVIAAERLRVHDPKASALADASVLKLREGDTDRTESTEHGLLGGEL